MGVVRKETKMVQKARRQDGRSVILMAPASNAGNAGAAARPVRLEPPQNRTILRTSTSRRGRSVPGKRVCAASRRQNRDGARPAGRGAMHLYGAVDDFEAVGRQHLQVLQFFQVRVATISPLARWPSQIRLASPVSCTYDA